MIVSFVLKETACSEYYATIELVSKISFINLNYQYTDTLYFESKIRIYDRKERFKLGCAYRCR